MTKLIAILNVIAWSGFWAIGYLTFTAEVENTGQMGTAAILASIGGGLGMMAYLWLIRHTEETGYAKMPNRAVKREGDDMAEAQ